MNPTGAQLLNKLSTSCGTKGSLPFSQENMIHAYSESNESSPYAISLFIHFNIILSYLPRSSEWSLSFMLLNQNCICKFCLRPVNYVYYHLIFLALIIIISSDENNYEKMHTIFSRLLSLPPSWLQI